MIRLALVLAVSATMLPAVAAAQDAATSDRPAGATAASDRPAGATGDVVVTGKRLESTAADLAACLARHCPPDQDIRATLAHAENQFVAGSYKDARKTLLASIGRNKREAKGYPVPVSDLLRANSRVSLTLGESQLYQVGAIDSLDALRAGLPASDPRVLAQRVEVADTFARTGRAEAALDAYRDIADDAHRAGAMTIEGYARLRRAALYSVLADVQPGVYEGHARDAVAWFAAHQDPTLAPFRGAAELLSARRAIRAGDSGAADALIARYSTPTLRPTLIYAPVVIEQDSQRASASGSTTGKLATGSVDDQWVDISFWVTPEGRVADVDALRESAKLDRSWVKPILAAIAQRRYAPLAMDRTEPGVLRVERYTRTAYWLNAQSGTHLRQREAIPRVEMVDLTADAPAKQPAPSAQPTMPNPVG